MTAIKLLEGAVQLLTGLHIVVSGCPFCLYVTKHVLMCVCFGKIPLLPRILLPISLRTKSNNISLENGRYYLKNCIE